MFLSPGTFYRETDSRPIEKRSIAIAVEMSKSVEQRHGAKPYGFYFQTRIVSEPIPDGEGGQLEVADKLVDESGTHFLTGTVETLDEIRRRADPDESILVSNMEGNKWPLMLVNRNSYKSVHQFNEKDCVVDMAGTIITQGDDPVHQQYRESVVYR